jgi:hypothetical protein
MSLFQQPVRLEVGFDVMLGARNPRHEGGHKRIFAELNQSGNP